MGDAPQLDDDQAAAAEIAPSDRQIVLAPPGSGKTEVVAALLRNLEEHGLESADEVLALSFSRAAVGALRRRLGSGSGPAPAITTLDSLAAKILEDIDEDEWRHLSFDKRIERATELLETGASAVDIAMVRHLVVDEVQDLVGIRARLVLKIIDCLASDAGLTLLGDPDQAVYDFQLENELDFNSADLLDAVRMTGGVTDRRLRTQYRARTPEARAAASMLAERPRGHRRTAVVRSFLATVPLVGDVGEVGTAATRWHGATAFLCRTNGQAMMIADELRRIGAAPTTRAAAEDLPVAEWIGEALGDFTTTTVRRDQVMDRLNDAPGGPSAAWRLLKQAESDYAVHDRLDLGRLRAALSRRAVPAELMEAVGSRIVISTVHRAKGLEFDNVVLVNASELLPGDAVDEEASVAYVAATRARDQLLAATADFPRFLRKDNRIGRWILGGPQSWKTLGIEVKSEDVEPVATGRPPDVPPGSSVNIVLDPFRSELDYPVYTLEWDGTAVARTSEEFGRRLTRRIGARPLKGKSWPSLSGLGLEARETRVAPYGATEESLIGTALRFSGMTRIHWNGSDQ
jgi:DNA helicase-2/ATP-dependent DNA helicase PcrA